MVLLFAFISSGTNAYSTLRYTIFLFEIASMPNVRWLIGLELIISTW